MLSIFFVTGFYGEKTLNVKIFSLHLEYCSIVVAAGAFHDKKLMRKLFFLFVVLVH